MKRGVWIVTHELCLRADSDATNEAVVGEDGFLKMHDLVARCLVSPAQILLVFDEADSSPASAVEGLHKERIADLFADFAQIKEFGVAVECAPKVGVRFVR